MTDPQPNPPRRSPSPIEPLEHRIAPATFIVTNVDDSGTGSLRDAIEAANADLDADIIQFQLTGNGPFVIAVESALPSVNAPVEIDGETQPGFAGTPLIELDGSLLAPGGQEDGLDVFADNTTIRGLCIHSFPGDGILLAANGNVVSGCYIGTDISGALALGNGGMGIWVAGNDNLIGGDAEGTGNLVSGNRGNGVQLQGDNNTVSGCYIGTDATGTLALGNGFIDAFGFVSPASGIVVFGANNTIGGITVGARNLISGNLGNGVYVDGSNNTVSGCYIGTDISGTLSLGNGVIDDSGINYGGSGVAVIGASNVIGGNTEAARNLISGNLRSGVALYGNNNALTGCYIGTDHSGASELANGIAGYEGGGVEVFGSNNTIGGTMDEERNVISGNANYGVNLVGGGNVVSGCYIGTDATGAAAIANGKSGVITFGSGNTIGGIGEGGGNLISGNASYGILVGEGSEGNYIVGNLVGTDADGTAGVGNAKGGINIMGGHNRIGGDLGNVIAFNGGAGVRVGSGSANTISHNQIFDNTGLGINLVSGDDDEDVTHNDDGDTDIGSNSLLNFPELTTIETFEGETTISGTYQGVPLATITIEVFTNSSADPSGFGEGATYVGSFVLDTDAQGKAVFAEILVGTFDQGTIFTATATDADGSTSEFSRWVRDNGDLFTVSIGDFSSAEGANGETIFRFPVVLSGLTGEMITLDYSLEAGTATAGSDFVLENGTIAIPPHVTSAIIPIRVIGDLTAEPHETFLVHALDATSAQIDGDLGTVRILNDDLVSLKGRMFTYRDIDGDLVTVKLSKGTITPGDVALAPGGTKDGAVLSVLDLGAFGHGSAFGGTRVTVTAKPGADGGNGQADVGFINAIGVDLSTVKISGDLGRIVAGDTNTKTPAVKTLAVGSLGIAGLTTQLPPGSLHNEFLGTLGSLNVSRDIGAVTIEAFHFGKINIKGDILGTAGQHALIIARNSYASQLAGGKTKAIGSLTVTGNVNFTDVLAGYRFDDVLGVPVQDLAGAQIGTVKITGDWIASNIAAGVAAGIDGQFGTADDWLGSASKIAKIAIKGRIGGTADVLTDSFAFTAGQIGSVTLGKSKLALTKGMDHLPIPGAVDVVAAEVSVDV